MGLAAYHARAPFARRALDRYAGPSPECVGEGEGEGE